MGELTSHAAVVLFGHEICLGEPDQATLSFRQRMKTVLDSWLTFLYMEK